MFLGEVVGWCWNVLPSSSKYDSKIQEHFRLERQTELYCSHYGGLNYMKSNFFTKLSSVLMYIHNFIIIISSLLINNSESYPFHLRVSLVPILLTSIHSWTPWDALVQFPWLCSFNSSPFSSSHIPSSVQGTKKGVLNNIPECSMEQEQN